MSERQVSSPLPGVFYHRPAPGQPAYVEIGEVVAADQVIGLVEVMKQFAEVQAGTSGRIVAFLIEDGGTVGPGEGLVTIDSDA